MKLRRRLSGDRRLPQLQAQMVYDRPSPSAHLLSVLAALLGTRRSKMCLMILTANLSTSEDPGCCLKDASAMSWWKIRKTEICKERQET